MRPEPVTASDEEIPIMIRKQNHYAKAVLEWGLNRLLLCLLAVGGSTAARAATVVDVQTVFGVFTLELYEQQAPQTVARFLENVDAGVYNLTMVHWAFGGVLRGGLFRFNTCAEGPVEVAPGVRACA